MTYILYRCFSKKVIKMLLSWKGIPRDFRNYLFLLLYIYLVIDTTVVHISGYWHSRCWVLFVMFIFVIILLFFQLCAYLRYGAVLKVLPTFFNTFKIKCTNDTQMITECYSPKQTNMGIFQFQGNTCQLLRFVALHIQNNNHIIIIANKIYNVKNYGYLNILYLINLPTKWTKWINISPEMRNQMLCSLFKA